MNDKLVILHVGPHKTGSTSLQYRLLKAREHLQQHSFEYPEFGISQFAHHQICSFLAGNLREAGNVSAESLKAFMAPRSRVILSSEDFIYLSKERLLNLRALLPDCDFQVVIFIRTPVDLWPSHWQELVKHGRDETLIEYLGAFCGWNTTIEAQIMNPFVQATKFAEVFGRERIRMFCYDNIVDSGIDIFDFFWGEVLGLTGAAPPGERRSLNPSLPLERIEMLRSLNDRFHQLTGRRPDDLVLGRYQKHLDRIESEPRYEDFCQVFKEKAPEIHLESTQEMIRNRERMLLNNFGDRIENKAAPNKIFGRDIFKKKIKYGQRYWTLRFGFGGFIDHVFNELDLL